MAQQDKLSVVLLKINGMKCSGCVKRVREELELEPEVISVDTVDLETKIAVVFARAAVSFNALESAVSKTGKKLESIQVIAASTLSEDLRLQKVFLAQLEALPCSSCVKAVSGVVENLGGNLVYSNLEDKIVLLKVPVEVVEDILVANIQQGTGKRVLKTLELGFRLLEENSQLTFGSLKGTRENSLFEYVFKLNMETKNTEICHDLIDNLLQKSLGMTNIRLPKELSYLLFAESSTKVTFANVEEAFKEIGYGLEWFLCYQDLKEELDSTNAKPVRTLCIETQPLISCTHCKENILSLLNNAAYVLKAEFTSKEYDMKLRVELESVRGFHSIEAVLGTFSRIWHPVEATCSSTYLLQDLKYFEIAKELVISFGTMENVKLDMLSEVIAYLVGVFFVQKNCINASSLRIVYDESVISESEIKEKVISLSSKLDSSRDLSNPTCTMDSNPMNNTGVGTLRSVKRYNCGCKMPNCCCLSQPLSESEDVFSDTVEQIVFKDSGSPRAVDELATFLSCRSCHVNREKSMLPETEPKLNEDEIFPCNNTAEWTDKVSSTSTPEPCGYLEMSRKHQTQKLSIHVSGMSCSSCVGAIESNLKQYDGIVHVSIGLITAMANIEFLPDKISPEEIQRAIESLGYEVSSPRVIDNNEEQISDELFLQVADSSTAISICKILEEQSEVARVKTERVNNITKQTFITQQFPLSLFFKSRNTPYLITVYLDQSKLMSWKSVGSKSCKNSVHINPKIRLVQLLNSRDFEYSVVNGKSAEKSLHQPQITQRLEMEANQWLFRFIIAAIFTVPLMIFSFGLANHVHSVDLFIGNSRITVAVLVEWILATFVQLIGGYPFYRGGYFAIFRSHRPNMDVLIAFATSVIYIYSVASLIYYSVVGKTSHDIDFDSSAMLITIISFGKWLETLAKKNSAKGLEMYDQLSPNQVVIVCKDENGDFIEIDSITPELLMVGDIIKVLPGERLAVDGIIEAGKGSVDESAITGESLPVLKQAGDFVFSGTSNRNSILYVRTTANGSQTTVSQILELVENAQNSHAPIEDIADTISSYFVIFIVSVAIIVFLIWVLLTEERVVPSSWYGNQSPVIFSLIFSVSVVAVACPCALGLATPTAFMTASSVAVRYGILLKESAVVQYLYNAACIVFDKTGTLTCGKPKVSQVQSLQVLAGLDMDMIIGLVAQVESHSDHPYASAIVRYAQEEKGLHISKQVQSFEEIAGCGVESVISNREICIGNWKWILSKCRSSQGRQEFLEKEHLEMLHEWMEDGSTVVVAAVDYIPCIAFRIHDELRPEAKQVVSFFREKNKMECWLVSGDNDSTAFAVAKAVGIPVEKVVSQALPGDKVKVVESLLDKYRNISGRKVVKSRVVFVGDGVNDGPALAAADVGVAVGSKNQLASSAASAIMVTDNIFRLVTLFHLSKVTFRRILLNYFWALVYNVVFVPGAAGVLFPVIRKQMPPWFAAILMASSSLSVSLSSLLLRFYRPLRK